MTYDIATYEIRVSEPTEIDSFIQNLPFRDSEELGVKCVDQDGRVITVEVNGDSYGIPYFEDELAGNGHYEILNCDVEIGAGEPQPVDKQRMEQN